MKKTIKILLFLLLAALLLPMAYLQWSNKNVNDLGLAVLAWVKKAKGDNVDLAALENTSGESIDHGIWDSLLQLHVDAGTGLVDYEGFQKSAVPLQAYLDRLSAQAPANNWSEAEKIAYWINVYNAFTVKLILDHYPLQSIKDIGDGLPMINSPWDIKFFKIAGVDFDLNTIEHVILRQQFSEPRIHFAINCASFSCPALRAEAYTGNRLERQLSDQARTFIMDPRKNILSSDALQLSKIFDWFESDFTAQMPIRSFLQKYTDQPITDQQKITYLEYDWRLNKQ